MFSLICAWINAWVNNREAGDLRRNHGHYDVIVIAQHTRASAGTTLTRRGLADEEFPWTSYSGNQEPLLLTWFDFNILRPRQNGRHLTDDIFKCIFLYENVWIPIWISLKGQINNIPALVQIMAWRRPGDKPLSEPMMVRVPTHICVTRPQWVHPTMDEYSPAQ